MYCGIDVAKNKSQVCILDKNKKVVKEFEITHNKEGFDELERNITSETRIALEVTGNYCKALYGNLKGRYNVRYVDNVQMALFAEFHNPTIKNDRIDARMIATFLASDYGKTIEPTRVDELKDLSRLYQKTIKQSSRYKYMFLDQLSIIFPELEDNSYIHNSKCYYNLLQKYPHPQLIAAASTEQIYVAMNEVRKVKGGRHTLQYCEKLKQLAANSVGVANYPTACFQYTVKVLIFYHELLEDIRQKMRECVMRTPYYPLMEEFGYNAISLSAIVGEVGDIRRFGNHKKFVSYCGFDVTETQSGKSINKKSFITKKGNSILRFTFYTLVLPHLKAKTELSQFYYRLKAAGKHAKKCHIATARKLAVKTYYEMRKCHYEYSLN